MNNLELRKLLLRLGISSNIEGYHFILKAYEILSKQQIHTSMMTVYKIIGKEVNKAPSSVERAIRHCINKSWNQGLLNKIYSTVPDNSVFLCDLYFNFDALSDIIKEEFQWKNQLKLENI